VGVCTLNQKTLLIAPLSLATWGDRIGPHRGGERAERAHAQAHRPRGSSLQAWRVFLLAGPPRPSSPLAAAKRSCSKGMLASCR
jgi:hypothetical protein